MKYRPWGAIDWSLSLSSRKEWYFIGTLGTEERSICSFTLLRTLGVLVGELLVQISDVDSKYSDRTRVALEARRVEFASNGGSQASIRQIELMAELFRIRAFAREAECLGTSVILDMTSLPKRFFFPILQTLVNSTRIQNLLLTYTTPARYASDAPLYENIEPWRTLPGFGGSAIGQELWIVSVGFLVESLRQYIGANPDERMKILIPFPAPLAALRRTRESVANLELGHPEGRFDKYRVETLDISAAFERIKALASQSQKPVAFAPFGPKPTSAAMCLYAIQKDSSVRRCVVDGAFAGEHSENGSALVLGSALHPDEQTAAIPRTAAPCLNGFVKISPAAKIEIADAEIGPLRNTERGFQSRQEAVLDVVEDSGHGVAG